MIDLIFFSAAICLVFIAVEIVIVKKLK